MNHARQRTPAARHVRWTPLAALALAPPAVVALASLTGGAASPWLAFLYVPLVLAGFGSLGCTFATAVWVTAAYVGVGASTWPGFQLALDVVIAQATTFFAVAFATAWLVRRNESAWKETGDDVADARTALDVQQMIGAAYDLNMTVDLVILKQRELIKADSYAVLLTEGGTLRVQAVSGMDPEPTSLRFAVHEEDGGWKPADNKPLIIADCELSPTRFSELDPLARSMLIVPLFSVERLVGLFYFGSHTPNAFLSLHVDRAEAFASSVVFLIQRAQLEEDLKRLAFTDVQTSLCNHRHFQEQLEEEVQRSQRYGRCVSLMFLDIDWFKAFNDTHGHPAGDQLLCELAQTVRGSLRNVDVPARYGGEEFVVICPETQKDQAVVLAERLCANIAGTDYVVDGSGPKSITVSIGVAAFPADAHNKADLVDAADKALYQAKHRGKNCVVAYDASLYKQI